MRICAYLYDFIRQLKWTQILWRQLILNDRSSGLEHHIEHDDGHYEPIRVSVRHKEVKVIVGPEIVIVCHSPVHELS